MFLTSWFVSPEAWSKIVKRVTRYLAKGFRDAYYPLFVMILVSGAINLLVKSTVICHINQDIPTTQKIESEQESLSARAGYDLGVL